MINIFLVISNFIFRRIFAGFIRWVSYVPPVLSASFVWDVHDGIYNIIFYLCVLLMFQRALF